MYLILVRVYDHIGRVVCTCDLEIAESMIDGLDWTWEYVR